MISRTKPDLDLKSIQKIFDNTVLGNVVEAHTIGDGEYNAVYLVKTDNREYILKVSPFDSTGILTYENDMMRSEVYWYAQMRAHTDISVPVVYYKDFSRKIIPADFFIMEKIDGRQLNNAGLTKEERHACKRLIAQMAAQLHKVTNNQYGYIQNGLYEDWYTAIRSMVNNLIKDCVRAGKRTKRGKKLLYYIDQNRDILKKAPCCLVNYDIWDANILLKRNSENFELTWIDPERAFWGDPMFEFVCLEMMTPLRKKTTTLNAYNQIAKYSVTPTREEKIRYAVGLGYMALIQETEKYYRYSPKHFGWWRNVSSSSVLYKDAFSILNR